MKFWLVLFLLAQAGAFQWPWEDSSSSTSASSSASSSSSSSSDSSSASPSADSFGNLNIGSRNAYQPYTTSCPSEPIIREATNISKPEREYIQKRHEQTNENLIDFLTDRAKLSDFDAKSFVENYSKTKNITIGLAFSGGGYRAMLNGAGQVLSLDDRFDDANDHGLGGLLQASTYLVGLSGGNWLVGLMVLNDWLSVKDIIARDLNLWNLEDSIFNPNGLNLVKTIEYYTGIRRSILAKSDMGFNTSVTDIWGRALSYQFFNDSSGGENVTWASIRNLSSFQSHDMPFPIVIADGRTPGTQIINVNSTVVEINPYELGSWDPSLNSFSDVQYIGTELSKGNPNATDACVVNFDNAGFIMGTSSSIFNQIVLRLGSTDLNGALKTILNSILQRLSYASVDIAAYDPNPFMDIEHAGSTAIVSNETLYLVDGGEDQQNVPFYPLIQQARGVDVIFGFDNSGDTKDNWPNGSSPAHTYQRQFSAQGRGSPFPYTPTSKEFMDDKLASKPLFFGCDAANLTGLLQYHDNPDLNETDIPLVVYIANTRHSYDSNTSTFKMSYDDDDKFGLIQNGFEVASRANLTDDTNWATCVGCAIIRRAQERLGEKQSDECQKCFQEYCWIGGSREAPEASSSAVSTRTSSSSSSSSSSTASASSSSSDKPKKNNAPVTGLSVYTFPLVFLVFGALAL
ncbi:uncharacterized protein CANTADRAFT_47681 [Suhomyces tanzawaensis NRRL Y-17324]|uniref:Lysophospholipase n=1 Tax=Suhomyces tanzawaensis NRRL Y-17324 TaxID=984487 RepID=A0A1E4SN85_9ASCO|nr:uncharacterized protein CANTADRAFT_47681 [Suhomyces tanzawaensis NRRL Y-17324]ODV80948.1 hypothetical protein CANTADRAFT_47681 [Suhomyces tanzawaensis NRRL Y-17324]